MIRNFHLDHVEMDKSRLHQLEGKMILGTFIGHTLNSIGATIEDLITRDYHNIEYSVISKVRLKKLKSKDVGIK